tara:strand:+ start:15379 stop:15687 length:309 start_codon:yes stop_codon:yes gene_type:complete
MNNEHTIRNLQARGRYGNFRNEPLYPNGTFTGHYGGMRPASRGMLPTGYLENSRYATNNSSTTWSSFDGADKIGSGLALGFLVGIMMYGVSIASEKVMKMAK